ESGTVNEESVVIKNVDGSKFSYNVDELDKRILVAIELNNTYSADVLAELTSTSLRTIRRALKRLTDSGYITRVGAKRNGHWVILKKK
ncbi:MAG: winged helix-turn-helix domain-containing protein, partial [Clostridia bacterium]|nr:winged helix-turn-helix domain-containing protein [Clostridia bacterium]